jgi:hypothetical protein
VLLEDYVISEQPAGTMTMVFTDIEAPQERLATPDPDS